MEILSTLFAFLLLLGFSAARPYVSSSTTTTTTTCTTKLKTTTTSTTTKCTTTASVKKYKSTTSSKSKAGGYHTKSTSASSKPVGYHAKSTSTSKAGGYAPKSSSTSSKAGGYQPKSTTTSSKAQYYGDNTSSTTLTTSTSKAAYPEESSTSTTTSASSTSSETSTSATTSDVTTTASATTTSSDSSSTSTSAASTTTTSASSTSTASTTSTTSTVSTTSSVSSSSSSSSSTTASVTTTTSSSITTTSSSVTTTSSSTTTASSTTTTVACQAVPTAGVGKRGLAYNYAAVTDLFATTTCPATSGTSKVTWAYNWYSAPQDPRLQEAPRDLNPFVQFVPMLWSAHPDLTSVWFDNVAAAKEQGWTEILAFNEPDLCVEGAGASCMTVEEAVEAYRTYISPLKAQGFRLGGPAVTSSETGKAWIRSFLQQCTGCNIDFIPIHWYGSSAQYGEFFSYLYEFYYGVVAQQYPLWVTEYGLTSGTADVVERFMLDTMYEMDTQATFVEKYAWYMAGAPGVFPGNLVSGRALSDFGKIYDKEPGRRPPPP